MILSKIWNGLDDPIICELRKNEYHVIRKINDISNWRWNLNQTIGINIQSDLLQRIIHDRS